MNKEEIYDSQISPLMSEIISIVKQHGISMIACFAIGHDGIGPDGESCSSLICNTLLPDETGEVYTRFTEADAVIRRGYNQPDTASLTLTTEHGDGTKTLTAFI